jgi:hypothetical protein
MDMGWSFGAMAYGIVWRKGRGAFPQHLNAHAVPQYHPITLEEIMNFLRKLKSQTPINYSTGYTGALLKFNSIASIILTYNTRRLTASLEL